MSPGERRSILLFGDLFVAVIAMLGGLYFWAQKDLTLQAQVSGEIPSVNDFLQHRVDIWFYFLPLFWILLIVNLYDLHRSSSQRRTIIGIGMAALTGLVLYALVYFVSPKGSLTRWGVGFFIIFATFLTLFWRLFYIKIFTAPAFMRRMLIIGAGKAGRTMADAYKNLQPPPFHLIGFIDDDRKMIGKKLEGFPILSSSVDLLDIVDSESITDLIIAITGEMHGSTFQTVLDAQERGLEIIPMPTLYEELLRRVPVQHLESEWLIRSFMDEARVSGLFEVGKRLLDILGALIGLGICIVLFPLTAMIILIDSGFPIMYSQTRAGKNGKPYKIYKFRTMFQDAEKDGNVHPAEENDERVTRTGIFLRRTHIDELPQFWNVLRGEMSIIGPRAERPVHVAEYQKHIPFYRARLLVKPGITGWAQINYGYSATIPQTVVKLEYDLYYIKRRNLAMDISIILRTVGQVIGLRGR